MIITILHGAPGWVWALLAALVALGVSQSFPRLMTTRRATIVPIALFVLSLYGVVSAFRQQTFALTAWVAGVATSLMLVSATGAFRGISWSDEHQRIRVPGSWLPLVLIMGLFATKFGVGASLAMQPSLAADPVFATAAGLAYGGFSGLFLGRGLVMLKVARRGVFLHG